jgi:hypothetical protein
LSTIQQRYVCGGYWARHTATTPEIRIIDKTKPLVMSFTIGGSRILILNSVDNLPELSFKPKIDFIVLSGSPGISVGEIVHSFNPEQLIISTDIKPWVVKRVKKEALEDNICFYNVIEQGAWVCETRY